MNKKDLIEAINRETLFYYIDSNYHKITKKELKEFLFQALLTLMENRLTAQDIDIEKLLYRLKLED